MAAEQLFVNSGSAEGQQSTSQLSSYSVSTKSSPQKFDGSVSALCWAYNEEDLIESYLLRLSKLLHETVKDFEIVVVDDCSTDRTNEIVRRIQEQVPEIRMVRNERNLNVGLSCQRAILAARKRSDTIWKAVISVINYALIRTLFRLPISDYQNVCFYPTKLIQSISYESRSSFVNPESLLKAYWKGASIVEVPISFIPRTVGVAKGTSPKALAQSVGDISVGCSSGAEQFPWR